MWQFLTWCSSDQAADSCVEVMGTSLGYSLAQTCGHAGGGYPGCSAPTQLMTSSTVEQSEQHLEASSAFLTLRNPDCFPVH